MKALKKLIAVSMVLCLTAGLAACGSDGDSETSGATTTPETEIVTETSSNAIESGTYYFDYVNVYGETASFTLTTKDTGKTYLTATGDAFGDIMLQTDSWTDNGDGTITTDPLDEDLDVEFLEDDGSIIWAIDGESATPVKYTEPTEFIERENAAPTTVGEAVGIYTFGYLNDYGVVVPYIIWLNSDMTAVIYSVSSWTGTHEFDAAQWVFEDGVVTISDISYEGDEAPYTEGNGATWFDPETYESSWVLDGESKATPVDYDGETGDIDLETLDESIYPANADMVGIYVFGFVNSYGVTVPYVVWLNADGTCDIYSLSEWAGMHTYNASSWTVNDDGTVTISDYTYYDEAPYTEGNDATWFDEETYESTWEMNADGTCVPVGYDGTVGEVDTTTISAEVYPQ